MNTKSKKTVDKSITESNRMTLGMKNYGVMLIGAAVILIGFALMVGGGSDSPTTEFDYGMFSFRRITLAPILVIVGFVIELIGIMTVFKKK